jgi:hypothetical protein
MEKEYLPAVELAKANKVNPKKDSWILKCQQINNKTDTTESAM